MPHKHSLEGANPSLATTYIMKEIKEIPQWLRDKKQVNKDINEPLVFVGERGADIVIDGKLPNGEVYDWKKRRK